MMVTVAARVFGPVLPPSGSNGTVTVSEATVEVAVGEIRLSPAIEGMQFAETGFGAPGLAITWHDDGQPTPGQWSAHVIDPAQANRLLASPLLGGHPGVASLLGRQLRVGRWRRLGWTALAAFVALPLLLLVAFLANADRIAGWITAKIPIEQEIEFGQHAFSDMKPDLKLLPAGPQLAAVRTIGERLTRGSRYPFQFHVVEDETINAFAMPGGIVVVHTGLIQATRRAEELAGVLAHEVQHVEQRHSLEGMVKQMGLYALWSLATGDLGGTLASRAALELTGLKFSRDAEEEADQKGFDALVAAGLDPSGMPAFFETMAAQGGDLPAGFLSTHPLSRDREAAMTARLSALPTRDFAPLGMTPWPPAR